MRPIVLLAFCLPLLSAASVDARLFWQSYGSTIPGGEGCGTGCSWNWNQDYFVPRHSSSGRYGLFSSCKTSCTSSPACRYGHPFYPGYCGIYGPCHYGRRNHVYQAYCGCTPLRTCGVPWRNGCGSSRCAADTCCASCTSPMVRFETDGYLPNVESSEIAILGSLSVEGDGLLANIDLTPQGEPEEQRVFLGPSTVEPNQVLPSLGNPQTEESAQPLPSPQPTQ